MQSRLATAANKWSSWIFPATRNGSFQRGLASSTSSTTADPAVHSKDRDQDPAFPTSVPEGIQDVAEPKFAKEGERERKAGAGNGPFAPTEPPRVSSPKLENPGLSRASQPNTQQKRRNQTTPTPPDLEEVSCAVPDPWSEEKEQSIDRKEERREARKEQEEDDKQYFKHHKASPLSEIKVADTRKPITRATDGTASGGYYGGGRNVIGWLPEQLDTAEDSLRRAAEIFKQNATRGDPNSPHGRVLRSLRGEWF